VFLERTFQLIKGVGPWREKDLWARSLATWSDFESHARCGVVMNQRLDAELLQAIETAREALARRELPALARLVPEREHWRLYRSFPDEAAFFDIEADGEQEPTVVGLLDADGVASFRRGEPMAPLVERLRRRRLWVTFNGGSFDIPVLRRWLPDFPAPAAHVDLRFLVRRSRLRGGLKAVEEELKMHRPPHLTGVRGVDAIRLWREAQAGRLDALRILVEYNLYDAVNLKAVLEWCQWRLAELSGWEVDREPIFDRGEVLYDISRAVLAASGPHAA